MQRFADYLSPPISQSEELIMNIMRVETETEPQMLNKVILYCNITRGQLLCGSYSAIL